MKKAISCIILLFIILFLTFNFFKTDEKQSINKKLLRFHVIANSDSFEDQSVKLKVRDAVLKNLGPQLENCSNLNESLKVIEENKSKIEKISNDILKREGKNYEAKAIIGEFQFPVKTYGNITLPAGEYTALRVVLGKGDGKNWWCVMFPPLCFIDITRGVTSKETDEELKRVLDEDEVKSITAFKQIDEKVEEVSHASYKNYGKTKSKYSPNIEFKFKSVEIFDKLRYIIKNNL